MNIIGNPPYSKNLHLQVLSRALEEYPEAEIVWLSPCRWLQDPLAEYKKASDFKRFPQIRERIESIDEMGAMDCVNEFGAWIGVSLGIYKLSKNGGTADLRNKICLKILSTGAYYDKYDMNQKDGWRVKFALAGGGGRFGHGAKPAKISTLPKLLIFKDGLKDGRPWYEFYNVGCGSKFTEEIPNSIKFANEKEAQNFIDTMNTKVGKYYYGSMMLDIRICPQYFLKLDYTRPWTDEDLYEYFDLTLEEIKEIESTIKNAGLDQQP